MKPRCAPDSGLIWKKVPQKFAQLAAVCIETGRTKIGDYGKAVMVDGDWILFEEG